MMGMGIMAPAISVDVRDMLCAQALAVVAQAMEGLKAAVYARLAQRARKMLQEEEFHFAFLTETFFALEGAHGGLKAEYSRTLDEAETALGSTEALTRLAATGVISTEALTAREKFLRAIELKIRGA